MRKFHQYLKSNFFVIFSDRCKLSSPKYVEAIQTKLTALLQKSLAQQNKDASTARRKFSKIMDVIIKLREMAERANKNWSKLVDDEFLQEVVPHYESYLYLE